MYIRLCSNVNIHMPPRINLRGLFLSYHNSTDVEL